MAEKPTYLTIPVLAALTGMHEQSCYRQFWSGHFKHAAVLVDDQPRVDLAKWEADRGQPVTPKEYKAALATLEQRNQARNAKLRTSFAAKKAEVRKSIPSISTLAA